MPRPAQPPAFRAVAPYTIIDARSIPESLTGGPGDPGRGAALYADPAVGCTACHGAPGASEARSAPDLAGIGGRLSAGEIRLRLVAPEVVRENTAMPAYYAAGQRMGAKDSLYGGPRLTAAEIEDLVAFLARLGTEPATDASPGAAQADSGTVPHPARP